MIKNKNLVCIGNTTWYGDYQKSIVQLLSRFGKNNNVLYVDYAFTIKDFIWGLLRKNKAPLLQMLGLKNRIVVISQNENGKVFKLTLPPVIPFNHFKNNKIFRFVLKLNSFFIAIYINKAIRKLKMTEVISITSFMPFYGLFLKDKLNEKLNIYYCFDPIDGKRNGSRGLTYEIEFMRKIDAVIVTSDYLASQKNSYNSNLFIVKNGVDFDLFRTAILNKPKQDIPKVICYTGCIDHRFETEIVEYCIQNTPNYEYIFVGPINDKHVSEKISKYTNVKILPPVPPEQIPLIIYNSHVGIIPYTRTELNKNVYPLKINEYLALGIPVVMTNFAQIPEFEELVSIISDKESFLEKIIMEIQNDTIEKQQKRIEFASKNSWDSRTEDFSNVIEHLLFNKIK